MEFQLSHGNLQTTVTTHGAELISLRGGDDTEYIWQGDPDFWSGRNPNLFPIVGALKGGHVTVNGKQYAMGRHGFARRKEFAVVEKEEDCITLELREDEETLAQYPFPFSLRLRHRLLEDGFETTFIVSNPGDGPLPFCVGGHTAIRCPLHGGERFQDYRLVFDQPEDGLSPKVLPGGVLSFDQGEQVLNGDTFDLDYPVFDRLDTVILPSPRSKTVSLLHRTTGRGVRMDFHEFPMVAFWTAHGPFLCLEPWHGCAAVEDETGDFRDKPHCVTLQPGEAKTLSYRVTLV